MVAIYETLRIFFFNLNLHLYSERLETENKRTRVKQGEARLGTSNTT